MPADRSTVRTTGIVIAMVAVVLVVANTLRYAPDVFFLVLLGILLAVFLARIAQFASRWTQLAYSWNLGIVVALLLLLSGVTTAFMGYRVQQQVARMSSRLDEGFDQFQRLLAEYPIPRAAFAALPFAKQLEAPPSDARTEGPRAEDARSEDARAEDERAETSDAQDGASSDGQRGMPSSNNDQARPAAAKSEVQEGQEGEDGAAASQPQGGGSAGQGAIAKASGQVLNVVGRIFSSTFGFIVNVIFIFFVGLFIAADPNRYRSGLVRLFPQQRRPRAREILDRLGLTLWQWLWGRLASMTITGVGTWVALALLGVPLAFTLGLITGLLTFIPNIGAVISLALAVMVALPEGTTIALSVVGIFIAFQLVESYIVTPLIDQHQVSVPPALLISFQLLMGILTGFLGVVVSTPLLAIGLVLINAVYIHDVLGDPAGEDYPHRDASSNAARDERHSSESSQTSHADAAS